MLSDTKIWSKVIVGMTEEYWYKDSYKGKNIKSKLYNLFLNLDFSNSKYTLISLVDPNALKKVLLYLFSIKFQGFFFVCLLV